MADTISFLRGLPRYEVFLEEAKASPGFDPMVIYSYLQLLRVGDELLELDEAILTNHGTGHSRFTLLMMLLHAPAQQLTPAQLAAKSGRTRATISGLLDGLERDGLIRRETDSVDRRIVRVQPTSTARELVDRVKPAYCDWISSVMSALDEDERRELVNLLEKLHERLMPDPAALSDPIPTLPS
jgi:DNA-binding MarR family transcriptional regulator